MQLCACNNYSNSELIQLQLQESYCLPTCFFLFFSFDTSQTKDLTVCWSSIYRIIFHYSRLDLVKCCIKVLYHSLGFSSPFSFPKVKILAQSQVLQYQYTIQCVFVYADWLQKFEFACNVLLCCYGQCISTMTEDLGTVCKCLCCL